MQDVTHQGLLPCALFTENKGLELDKASTGIDSSEERGVAQAFDYDLIIVGAGVGGHAAALHAVACGLKVAVIEAGIMGGTCVNRGCQKRFSPPREKSVNSRMLPIWMRSEFRLVPSPSIVRQSQPMLKVWSLSNGMG